jgi:hypothetical protein
MIRGLVAAAAAASLCAGQATVSDCAGSSGLFQITGLSITPATPVVGQNETLTVDYTVPIPVSAGSAEYSCVLNGIPIFHQTSDLCTQTACPIVAGVHHDVTESPVPDFSGKLACTIHWKDLSAKELLCIQTILRPVSYLRGSTSSGGYY